MEKEKILKEREKKIEDLSEEYGEYIRQLHAELRIAGKCAEVLARREFFESIPLMMVNLGQITEREATILQELLRGTSFNTLAERYGLTRERIRQLTYRAIRRSVKLKWLKDIEDDNTRLWGELNALREVMKAKDIELERLRKRVAVEVEHGNADAYDDSLYQTLTTPIKNLNISVRACNVCRVHDIETLGDLAMRSEKDFLGMRNFGRKTLREVYRLLEKYHLHFDYDVLSVYRLHEEQINK